MQTAFLHTTGISQRVFLAHYVEELVFNQSFKFVLIPKTIKYDAHCNDFGPMNMSCIFHFIRMLDRLLVSYHDTVTTVSLSFASILEDAPLRMQSVADLYFSPLLKIFLHS